MKQTFYSTRSSICPKCLERVAADHVSDEDGLHMEKYCPEHGLFRTRIASDRQWFKGLQDYAAASVEPETRQTGVSRGCPYDCGECTAHRQKSVFFLFEITDGCNLNCPICLGAPKAKSTHISPGAMASMLQTVLAYAGSAPIVTLGGGEPTVHPRLFEIIETVKAAGIEAVWMYTNGVKIARDPALAQRLVDENLYMVLQWDGFADDTYEILRGRALLNEKKQALSNLKRAGARIGICPTIVSGVNEKELGGLYELFIGDPQIIMLDIATMAYVGRAEGFGRGLQKRITAQDVLMELENQTDGAIRLADFSPISFSNPECLQICYLFALPDGGFIPLKRFLEPADYDQLIRNTPLLDLNADAEDVFRHVINRLWAGGKEDEATQKGLSSFKFILKRLFPEQPLSPEAFKRRSMDLVKTVLVHSYMDGLNFDAGRAKMCISRTVQVDGRMIPTCAYNVLHRR